MQVQTWSFCDVDVDGVGVMSSLLAAVAGVPAPARGPDTVPPVDSVCHLVLSCIKNLVSSLRIDRCLLSSDIGGGGGC